MFLDPTSWSLLATASGVNHGQIAIGIGIGIAGLVIGTGIGISKIASAAVESIARQPEAAGDIKTAMILTASYIEGVALFATIVCLLCALRVIDMM